MEFYFVVADSISCSFVMLWRRSVLVVRYW